MLPVMTTSATPGSHNKEKKTINKKSSVVPEMGDRLATVDMGRKVGAAVPLSV